MSPALKRHLELQIKTLQNAPRDPDKLEMLLKVKQREKEEAMHIEDTAQRCVTERFNCSRWYCIWWRGKAQTRKCLETINKHAKAAYFLLVQKECQSSPSYSKVVP
jgi:hypothetical protein